MMMPPKLSWQRWMRTLLIGTSSCAGFCLLLIGVVQLEGNIGVVKYADRLTPAPIAIVLGASLKADGTASDALRDRVDTGVDLYRRQLVQRLLLTGDDGEFYTNEVAVMKTIAMQAGVPATAILVDGHGYRTYESCKRAAQVFHIQAAIIVTQRFHLGRAVYLCHHFGIASQGFSADRRRYRSIVPFALRDGLASVKAWWDINIHPPKPPVTYVD